MTVEKLSVQENENHEELVLEIYEVSSSTVLEEMGASLGIKNCCSIVNLPI